MRALGRIIVRRDYPSYWDDHSAFLKDLKELQAFRNQLADSVLDVSDEMLARPLEDGLLLVQWKSGAPISGREFDEWCSRASMVSTTLAEIKMLLPFKERAPS